MFVLANPVNTEKSMPPISLSQLSQASCESTGIQLNPLWPSATHRELQTGCVPNRMYWL